MNRSDECVICSVCFSSLKEDAGQRDAVQNLQPVTAKEPHVITSSAKPCPPPVREPPSEPQAPRTLKPCTPTAVPPSPGSGAVSGSPLAAPSPGVRSSAAPQNKLPVDGFVADPQTSSANQKHAPEEEGPMWAALEEAGDAGGGGRTGEGVRREEEDQQKEGVKAGSDVVDGG